MARLPAVCLARDSITEQLIRAVNELDPQPLAALAIEFLAGQLDDCALFLLSRDEANARADSGERSPEWFWMPHFWDGEMTIVEFTVEERVAAEAAVRETSDVLGVGLLGAKSVFFDVVGRELVANRRRFAHSTDDDFAVLAARHENFEMGLVDSISWTAGATVTRDLQRAGLLPTQADADEDGGEWARLA